MYLRIRNKMRDEVQNCTSREPLIHQDYDFQNARTWPPLWSVTLGIHGTSFDPRSVFFNRPSCTKKSVVKREEFSIGGRNFVFSLRVLLRVYSVSVMSGSSYLGNKKGFMVSTTLNIFNIFHIKFRSRKHKFYIS